MLVAVFSERSFLAFEYVHPSLVKQRLAELNSSLDREKYIRTEAFPVFYSKVLRISTLSESYFMCTRIILVREQRTNANLAALSKPVF